MATKLKAVKPEVIEQGKCKGLISGGPGVGKTFFALNFPAPYYIDTEGGARQKQYRELLKNSGGVYLGPEEGATDFGVIIEQMQALATERHSYRTLIIDSITKVFHLSIAAEAERLGAKDAFGASKKPAIAYMRRLFNWCQKLDMNIWFVSHEITEWGVNPISGNREEVGKIPDVWEKLVYELDLCFRVTRRGKDYPAQATVYKSRLMSFQLGTMFQLDYSSFSEKYGKDYIESDVKQIVLARPEQIAEIENLISVVKVSESEIEKILTTAAAATWAELTDEQAQKTIHWLNNKIKGGAK
jgi:hypothetical protein